MKKIINFFLVASLVTLVACGGKKSDMVAGSWKLGDMSMGNTDEMTKGMPDSLKSKMEAEMKARMDDMKKSASFDFNKDGSFSIKMMGKETKGKWKLNEDGTKMTMTNDGTDGDKTKEETSDVIELTAAKMVMQMSPKDPKSTITLVK